MVTVKLEAGALGSSGPFNFDGYTDSGATLVASPGSIKEVPTVMRFTVPSSGSYRIFCGVPGHGLSGIWIRFNVDPTSKVPGLISG